jgi:hypothetical protein
MLSKKQMLFAYPEAGTLKFDGVFEEICEQPLVRQKATYTITARCMYDHHDVGLAIHAHLLQKGNEDKPVVIYLPWYGGKSTQSRDYFDTRRHPDWTHIGIDIFSTKEAFDHVLASAVVSQYAYALVIRMMAEQVGAAHKANRRVGVVGMSYGANVLSAYTTRGLEAPDAIAAVEGGSILQTTLRGKYRGHDCDPRLLQALKQQPELVPVQEPVSGGIAAISAAVINRDDKIVIGQEESRRKNVYSGRPLSGPAAVPAQDSRIYRQAFGSAAHAPGPSIGVYRFRATSV